MAYLLNLEPKNCTYNLYAYIMPAVSAVIMNTPVPTEIDLQ